MFIDATLGTDGYKTSHGFMYPKGTTEVFSNFTPRTVKHFKGLADYDKKIVVIGTQGAIQEIHEMWRDSFFVVSCDRAVGKYKAEMDMYLGPDAVPVDSLVELHKLGYLPIEVRAIEEGNRVDAGIPILTIRNTDPRFFWLVNYLETVLSNLLWKPSTCATVAYEYKRLAEKYAKLTGVDDFTVSIQCHDFSGRGAHGPEDAARSGLGHAASFLGSDTLFSTSYARRYYDEEGLVSISVPATEHAVTSSNILSIQDDLETNMYYPADGVIEDIVNLMVHNGEDIRLIAEVIFVYRLITEIVPTGIVSNVSDTYDFWGMLTRGYPYLKDVILNRPDNALGLAKVVVRPDSGDPVEVICGLGDIEEVEDLSFYSIADAVEGNDAGVVKFEGKYYRPIRVEDDWYAVDVLKGTQRCMDLIDNKTVH